MKMLAAAACAAILSTAAVAQDATREITNVAGDVYRFQNNFHFSLVVATSEGTVVVDPINAGASGWLNDNLASITDQPVTHLIYSHSHGDHASGGSNYSDATVIAHANAPANIDGVVPDTRFDASHSIEIGGKTIELTYLGPGHGEDMIAVVVRPENVAFIVDIASPRRLLFQNMQGANMDDWLGQLNIVQALDFEVFAPGHGVVGNKSDFADAREYVEVLRAEVLAGLKAGKSIAELQTDITLDAYSGWQQYGNWRAPNIEGMARYLIKAGLVE